MVDVSVMLNRLVVVFGRLGVCLFLKYGCSMRFLVFGFVVSVRCLSLL